MTDVLGDLVSRSQGHGAAQRAQAAQAREAGAGQSAKAGEAGEKRKANLTMTLPLGRRLAKIRLVYSRPTNDKQQAVRA